MEVKTYTNKEEKKQLMKRMMLRVYVLCRQIEVDRIEYDLTNFVGDMNHIYSELIVDFRTSDEKILVVEDIWRRAHEYWSKLSNADIARLITNESVRTELVSKVEYLNFIVNRIDDGQDWNVKLENNVWWVKVHGSWQSITNSTPMLTATYTSHASKIRFMISTIDKVHALCLYRDMPTGVDGESYRLDVLQFEDFKAKINEIFRKVRIVGNGARGSVRNSISGDAEAEVVRLWVRAYRTWQNMFSEFTTRYVSDIKSYVVLLQTITQQLNDEKTWIVDRPGLEWRVQEWPFRDENPGEVADDVPEMVTPNPAGGADEHAGMNPRESNRNQRMLLAKLEALCV
jgi:hypothetical protein